MTSLHNRLQMKKNTLGVVLIELIVALGIVAILSTFTYLGYQRFAIRKDVSNGKQYLLEFQQKQGLFYLNRRRYATSAEELGMPDAPVGSESQFEPVKIFLVRGDEIDLTGGDFYTATLDIINNRHAPLSVSEDGLRWVEFSPECYEEAKIGPDSQSINIESLSSIQRLKIIAKCRFDQGDQRWDQLVNENQRQFAGVGEGLAGSLPSNQVAIFYHSLPSEVSGEPPRVIPPGDPNCDADDQNTQIFAGNGRNFTIDGSLKTCYCPHNGVSITQNENGIQCSRYIACGTTPGTYISETNPGICNTIFQCDSVTNLVNGAIEPNVKTDIIYADPDNNDLENGYKVWCSARGVLTVDTGDPRNSTCYQAICSDDGQVVLDEDNNLAQWEIVFNCAEEAADLRAASQQLVVEESTGDVYRVSCDQGTDMNFKKVEFRSSTCTKYVCSRGEVGIGDS